MGMDLNFNTVENNNFNLDSSLEGRYRGIEVDRNLHIRNTNFYHILAEIGGKVFKRVEFSVEITIEKLNKFKKNFYSRTRGLEVNYWKFPKTFTEDDQTRSILKNGGKPFERRADLWELLEELVNRVEGGGDVLVVTFMV